MQSGFADLRLTYSVPSLRCPELQPLHAGCRSTVLQVIIWDLHAAYTHGMEKMESAFSWRTRDQTGKRAVLVGYNFFSMSRLPEALSHLILFYVRLASPHRSGCCCELLPWALGSLCSLEPAFFSPRRQWVTAAVMFSTTGNSAKHMKSCNDLL